MDPKLHTGFYAQKKTVTIDLSLREIQLTSNSLFKLFVYIGKV